MIPHHVYYQLTVIGLLWLCIMLHYTWPSRSAVSPKLPTESVPTKLKRKRTSEPTPFAGLIQRPPCAACEHDAHYPKPSAPRRPDPRPATNRRPCTIDTSMHFCPHDGCDYRGWLGLGNLRANGLPTICQPRFVTFLPHLHGRLTTNAAGIIAGTIPQHGREDTQQSIANTA
jgi:hypothetical protein